VALAGLLKLEQRSQAKGKRSLWTTRGSRSIQLNLTLLNITSLDLCHFFFFCYEIVAEDL